jgi:hypothetical protein
MSRKPTLRKSKNGAKPVEPMTPPAPAAPAAVTTAVATPPAPVSPRREPVSTQPLCTESLKTYSIVPKPLRFS